MRIALNDSVELQNPEAVFCTLFQAVQNEFLTDVLTAEFGADGIACVADVSASADIVRVEDIETGDITVDLCNTRICLRFEECLPGSHIKKLFLRKSDSFFNDVERFSENCKLNSVENESRSIAYDYRLSVSS